jgi:hypothetical protein
MLTALIDEHPAGWSTIVAPHYGEPPMQCYCHGMHYDPPDPVTTLNAAHHGCEYVYALNADPAQGDLLYVLTPRLQHQRILGWTPRNILRLSDPEPQWDLTEDDK